ncbi:STAS domain-containing protein [Pseudonocardia humida]|uniref:Anti-sigma factor antagonist n=1 Tax=Pseudonocardia humida TaxID=2800819 RepID=A0ABT1A1X7_9PSEU|nr:STAS domain-containing protein [Pseudonocardia humida]MCO1657013.1 anti-sigma factor antagonist [Pseudonocardia humida]
MIDCERVSAEGDERRVRVVGEVDLASAPRLRSLLLDELERVGGGRFVVDLGGIGFFSAAGLHVLEDVAAAADGCGAELVLRPLSSTVALVLSSCDGALAAHGPTTE